ncbi:MAG: fasciclin domain-containing protein [Chitinophagaceae bacterium]|nr:fasciclin domain-containing protein [Chitinophagaceae bacterium]
MRSGRPQWPDGSIAGYTTYSYKDKVANAIYINGAAVSERDIYCSNGIIHKIDKALNVPNLTMLATLTASSDYSPDGGGDHQDRADEYFFSFHISPSTVFAIPNSVMFANGYDASTIAGLSGAALTTLSNILKYHVVASRNFSNALKAGNLKTVYGTNVVAQPEWWCISKEPQPFSFPDHPDGLCSQ